MFESRVQRRKKKLLRKKYRKAEEVSGSQIAIAFRRFRKNKAGLIGLIFSVLIFVLAIFSDFIAPFDPNEYIPLEYDYRAYTPFYKPPGFIEGSLYADTYRRMINPSFEAGTVPWNFIGAERVNLSTLSVTGGLGTYAARLNNGVEISQDISSNDDLYFIELTFLTFLEDPSPSTLSVIFRFDDDREVRKDISLNDTQWLSFTLDLTEDFDSKIHNPEEVVFVNSGSSSIIIDDVNILGGTYFRNAHLMGVNFNGEDLFTRLVYGTRVSLIVSVGAILISLFIGLPLGLMAGYYRGRVDEAVMRLTDLFLTLPFYFVMILVIILIQNTRWLDNLLIELQLSTQVILVAVTVGLGIFGWMGITRLIRATIFQVRETDYVEAARALGASNRRIMVIHILPNILAPLIVVVTLGLAGNILVEAGLAFLGFTSQELASWGRELNNGFAVAAVAWWSVFFPALFIVVAVMAFNLFGDGLRDAFDPRLR